MEAGPIIPVKILLQSFIALAALAVAFFSGTHVGAEQGRLQVAPDQETYSISREKIHEASYPAEDSLQELTLSALKEDDAGAAWKLYNIYALERRDPAQAVVWAIESYRLGHPGAKGEVIDSSLDNYRIYALDAIETEEIE
jgi:TPR repeat protein